MRQYFTTPEKGRVIYCSTTKSKLHSTLWGIASNDANEIQKYGQERVGYLVEKDGKEYLRPVQLDPKGLPAGESKALTRCSHHRSRPLLYWGEGIIGIAETHYPRPKGLTLIELYEQVSLHQITVRHLTRAFREHARMPPNCERAWELNS